MFFKVDYSISARPGSASVTFSFDFDLDDPFGAQLDEVTEYLHEALQRAGGVAKVQMLFFFLFVLHFCIFCSMLGFFNTLF